MDKNLNELMGNYARAMGTQNWNDVMVWATEILKIDDKLAHVWGNRAVALSNLGFPLDAVLNVDRALALEQEAKHLSNKGCYYWDMGDDNKALTYLHEAADMEPLAQTYLTIGNIHKTRGDLTRATKEYRQCVALEPNYADGHMVLGMALLKQGNLQEGWKEYEWRWKTSQLPERKLKCPQWKGQDLTGKTILVYGEQGLGDIVQFSRYARQLANLFPRAKVIIEGRPQLKRLLATMPDIYAVINAGDKLPELDYAIPMITLAGMLTASINFIRADDRQFFLHPTDVENWSERVKELPEGLKVGVCWSGMLRSDHPSAAAVDRLRSTELATFAPLARIPGITWISLQKGAPAEQIKEPPKGMVIADMTNDLVDFYDTACLMANCDLVISVDTAVLHVAASVGVPTWLLSRWDGCWRWFGDKREDSPWYPTLRQFSQPALHDWPNLMSRVAMELKDFIRQSKLDLTNDLSYLPDHSEP